MKITMAQINPIVGDLNGNLSIIKDIIEKYKDKTDLIVFPELCMTGYPPQDLLNRNWFINMVEENTIKLVKNSKKYPDIAIIIGTPTINRSHGKGLYNSALLIQDGNILLSKHKTLIPTYDVFDEARYFDPCPDNPAVNFMGETLGISICEDAWNPKNFQNQKLYNINPIKKSVLNGADILINISASPYEIDKEILRYKLLQKHAKTYNTPVVFVNQVGGNDELIFEGRSMAFDQNGDLIALLPSFKTDVVTIDTDKSTHSISYKPADSIKSVHDALVLGINDYVTKSGFKKVAIGLSGGIDSAVTCAMAVKALGSKNVMGILMPSQYSSEGSIEDSKKLSKNLNIQFHIIPINSIFNTFNTSLSDIFKGYHHDITEENIQARIRGNLLMAVSNKFGCLILTTGNKSELAIGYCTLYGDMCGGLSVISDIPKTMVYKLAEYINKDGTIIPASIFTKPPSAELRPDQKDQDTLPGYEILDKVLYLYIEKGLSVKDIILEGFDEETVKWIVNATNKTEYKRRQAAPGLRITPKAFGMGRRMPIAAKYL